MTRILVAEHNKTTSAYLYNTLKKAGNSVDVVDNCLDAWRVSSNDCYDILVVDVVMPGISGKTLAEELSHARPDLKTLFMSGYTDEAIIQHGILDSGVAFLPKPFSPMGLATTLRSVLEGKNR